METGPSNSTARKNACKAAKRRAGASLGAARLAKKHQQKQMRSIERGVKICTGMDTVNDLKRTGPAFKGKNMTTKEAQEMKKLKEFHYIPSIPG